MSSVARLVGLALGSVLALAMTARGAGPADSLFRLVPADAAATLAVEDLRGRARDFLASPVAEGFRRLPAFQAWIASDRFTQFKKARERIESVLGEKVSTIRDELFGDAVVLTLHVPPDGRPEEARGMLLVHVRDRALLDRLIRGVNEAQTRSGELTRLARSSRLGVTYWSREFRPASRKPQDYFTVLDDNTFAWSNAEDLVQGVIDRRGGKARSLADEPKFQQVRRRLPEQSAVSLFVEPGFIAQLLTASARPKRPAGDRASAVLGRYLGAMDYFGAALQWRDGIVLHTEEILDPRKLDPWIRRWASRMGEIGASLRRSPPNALAMASAHLDFNAILALLRDLTPDPKQPRFENLIVALDGILLGRDLQDGILPQLGPGVLAYVEAPDADAVADSPDTGLAKVLVVGLGNATGLPDALENALRTYLAIYALDPRHGGGRLQLESRDVDGRKVTSLRPTTPLAYAIDRDRLVLGSSAAAVARAITQAANPTEGAFEHLRAARFPQAGSFACVDMIHLHQFVLGHRAPLVARLATRQRRTVEDAERDLDEAIALMALFRQAYLTVAIEPDATAVHRSLGLIPRGPAPAP